MSAAAVLAAALADGLTLDLKPGGKIRVRGPDEARARHLPAIKANKPDLLRLLAETHRTWDVTKPDGASWRSCVSPPLTWAALLAAYPAGTQAVPVEDPDIGANLPIEVVEAVNGWLDQIGEDDHETRAQILAKAQADPGAMQTYIEKRSGGGDRP